MIEAKQIDWSLVPEWAGYVAMDDDGEAYGFTECPEHDEDGVWASPNGQDWPIPQLNDYIDRSQWRSSLARRPANYQPTINEDQIDSCDNITRPSHYVIKDGVEVIDVREWWLESVADWKSKQDDPLDPYESPSLIDISHLERAMEYLLRAPGKNGMEDVRKAYQYLHRALHGEWPQ